LPRTLRSLELEIRRVYRELEGIPKHECPPDDSCALIHARTAGLHARAARLLYEKYFLAVVAENAPARPARPLKLDEERCPCGA